MPYKGETPSKTVSRRLVWWQHERLLGPVFKSTPHIFLASEGEDIDTLRHMGVTLGNIWAVDKNREAIAVVETRGSGFRAFDRKVETVVEDFAEKNNIQSVYLDYCGNIQGSRHSLRRVVSRLPTGSALSVTLFLGRELVAPISREADLLSQVREHARFPVSLAQEVKYSSRNEASISHMTTWTVFLGGPIGSNPMRFDLSTYSDKEIADLATSERKTRQVWQRGVDLADKARTPRKKAS